MRVKWSRRRVETSHSEDSLAVLLSERFGEVEEVELVGGKGNAALVTFRKASSCAPCVEAYRGDAGMRATFVVPPERKKDDDDTILPPLSSLRGTHHDETPRERALRQAAEREELLRRMEMDETDGAGDDANRSGDAKERSPDALPFYPPPFPIDDDDDDDVDDNGGTMSTLTPLQRLEKFERVVLSRLATFEQ